MTPPETMDYDFLWQTRFSISIAKWSVEKDDTIMGNVAKGKGKTRGKNRNTGKCAENLLTAFKIMIVGDR